MAKNDDKNNSNIVCTFCGKKQNEVKRIIAGPGVNICNECVELCQDILDDDYTTAEMDIGDIAKPREIAEVLDQYVVGQSDVCSH